MNEYEHHYLNGQQGNITQEVVARCKKLDNGQLFLVEIWIRTSDGASESKVKINLPALATKITNEESIILTDEALEIAYSQFDDIIEPEVKAEYELETIVNKLQKRLTEQQTNELISAAEAALSAHPTNLSIQEIVDQINKNARS